MKCTCGREFTAGQSFCLNCKRPLKKKGYGIVGDTNNNTYSLKEIKDGVDKGLFSPLDVVISFPDGKEVIIDSLIHREDFKKESISVNSIFVLSVILTILFPVGGIFMSWFGYKRDTDDKPVFKVLMIISIAFVGIIFLYLIINGIVDSSSAPSMPYNPYGSSYVK